MDFSTNLQVAEAYNTLSSLPIPECPGCQKGVAMCKRTPCMGTPDDIEKLMNAGYSKNLMLDWWLGGGTLDKNTQKTGIPIVNGRKEINKIFEEDVPYLVPAIIGYEGKKSPFTKSGTCNLLKDDLCSVHAIKPIQGKIACCKINYSGIDFIDERIPLVHSWNTQRGRDLIEKWKKEVNFTLEPGQSEQFELPKNPLDLLVGVLGMLMDTSQINIVENKD